MNMILFIFFIIHSNGKRNAFDEVCDGKADAVFLWVNGTSEKHLELMKQYGKVNINGLYKDYGTLRFGLRSVVTYAPWINRIFLITNGEVPQYLDVEKGKTSNPQFFVISHSQIMNESILPTFNSNVIESYIHHIPGISKCILYLNDDMMLGRPLDPDFFIQENARLKVYHNGFIAPNKEGEKKSIWHRSVSHSNELLSDYYSPGNIRIHPYPSHHCYFFLTNHLKAMEERWKANYTQSRENKFRKANDIVISFLHAGYTVEENKGDYMKQQSRFYLIGGQQTEQQMQRQ